MKNPKLLWHAFFLVLSFNFFSFCTHTAFCWAYNTCANYPLSMHVLFYAMRMSDFSYGLLSGVVLVVKLNRPVAEPPHPEPDLEGQKVNKIEILN